MLIEDNTADSASSVTAYRNGVIEAGGRSWHEPVVVRGSFIGPSLKSMPSQLQADDFFQTASQEGLPEVIIVGTGAKQEFLHPRIVAEAAARGVGLECMNTASACRTLVLLQGERRRVWAWLWP